MTSALPTASAMATTIRVNRPAVGLTVEIKNRVLYAAVIGLVTVDVIDDIRTDLVPSLGKVLAVCVDYSRALLTITRAGMDRLYLAARPGTNALIMSWVVPDEATAKIWRWQAARFSDAGVLRFVSTDLEEAQSWARDQARRALQHQASK